MPMLGWHTHLIKMDRYQHSQMKQYDVIIGRSSAFTWTVIDGNVGIAVDAVTAGQSDVRSFVNRVLRYVNILR